MSNIMLQKAIFLLSFALSILLITTANAYLSPSIGVDNQFIWEDHPFAPAPLGLDANNEYIWWYTNSTVSRLHLTTQQIQTFTTDDVITAPPTAIALDHNGDLWLGTTNGLQRFNGQTWTYYTTNEGLSDNNIQALSVNPHNKIVIATSAGVDIYDNGQWSYNPFFSSTCNSPLTVAMTTNNRVWIGQRSPIVSGFLCYYENNSWQILVDNFAISARYITASPDGSLWAADASMGIIRVQPDLSIESYTNNDSIINSPGPIGVSNDLHVWSGSIMATAPGAPALGHFNGSNWQTYASDPQTIIGSVTDIAIAPNGTPWITTDLGHIMGYTGSQWHYAYSIPPNNITFMDADHDNNLWFANNSDLTRYDGHTWHNFPTTPDLPAYAYDIATTPNGDVWISGNNFLFQYDGANWTKYDNSNGLPMSARHIKTTNNGDVWIGAIFVGVARYDGANWHIFDDTNALLSNLVSSIHVHADQTVWVSYGEEENAISYYNGATWQHIDTSDGLTYPNINAFVTDRQGDLWALAPNAVNHYDGTNWTTHTLPITDAIELAVDNNNDIWIASATQIGMHYFDGTNWHTVTSAELGNRQIYGHVANTPTGELWFATDTGLSSLINLQATDQIYLPIIRNINP
ncbi:MAG TPA: hypothetical protein VLL52_09300 [Anaerolineae bacterium]|nr:hypothetical protein [Anaerolineae bacterium]